MVRDVETGEELLISYGKSKDTDWQAWVDVKDDNDEHDAKDLEGGRKGE